MCLIIHRPAGSAPIPEEFLVNGLLNNPDGWGIVETHRRKIRTTKGIDPLGFWDAYQAIPESRAACIHFRFGTHGPNNVENCHPFPVAGGQYQLVHNGIINVPIVDKLRSDTYHFAENVLTPILAAAPDRFATDELHDELSAVIGGSKLVIIRADGKTMFVNRHHGVEVDGLWLSNGHSIEPPFSPREDFWNLRELAEFTMEEISDVCAADPDLVAELIANHFAYHREEEESYDPYHGYSSDRF